MASHRRPKQPSRTRVTVLTATAAAAVALTSQAAHADPKPSKSEVKAKVDKLYHEAEAATEKYNGAKEQQDNLKKEVDALQDKVARGQAELNTLRTELGLDRHRAVPLRRHRPVGRALPRLGPGQLLDQASALDQLTVKQTEALQKIQSSSAPRPAAQGGPGQARATSPTSARHSARTRRSTRQAGRRPAALNTLHAGRAGQDAAGRAARQPCRQRPGRTRQRGPASNRGAAAPGRRRHADRQAARLRRVRPQLLRLLRADPVGLRPGERPHHADHVHQQHDGQRIGRSQLKPG